MSKIQKIILSFLSGIVLMISMASPAFAQTTGGIFSNGAPGPWYSQSPGQFAAKVFGGDQSEIFGERYTYAQTQWVLYSLILGLVNLGSGNNPAVSGCLETSITGNVTTCVQPLIDSQKSVNDQFKVTASGKSKSIVAMIFEDRTLSGITYVKDLGRKFHVIPQAKAQSAGFGYTGALGVVPDIQKAWGAIRDISYAIFVFIIIIFAFMIMFRIKISPQVVVSVQSALPKIAITLILVTFSYAIAGFLIDIMYVVIGIFSLIIPKFVVLGAASFSTPASSPGDYFNLLTQGPAFYGISTGVLGLMVNYFINYFLVYISVVFGGFVAGISIASGAGGIGGSIISLVTFFIGLIGLIIVFIMAIINFFKIIFLLAKTFLSVILLTIFAPIMLTLGAVIPGFSFGSWVKSFASKLAVFPAVGVMFIIALWFLQIAFTTIVNALLKGQATSFAAGWPPLLGGSPQLIALLFLIASIAIFTMIPKVGDMVEALMAGKAFNYGSAIGEATAIPRGIGQAAVGSITTPQELAAKDAGQSPYAYGAPADRIKYAVAQGINSALGGGKRG